MTFKSSHQCPLQLKTPLAIMQNYATILQSDGLSDEEKREYAGKIAGACRRLSIMVSNILQLNRLENQKVKTQKKPYNLSEQISRCAISFAQVWEEKDIEVESDLDRNIILNSDENLLDIVWNNLIANALKFTPNGGTVQICTYQEQGYAIVEIEDTGCGIEEASIKHIFDKFYQVDTSHSTAGNGLGLALVKKSLIWWMPVSVSRVLRAWGSCLPCVLRFKGIKSSALSYQDGNTTFCVVYK